MSFEPNKFAIISKGNDDGGGSSVEMEEDVEIARALKRGREVNHTLESRGHETDSIMAKTFTSEGIIPNIHQQQTQAIYDVHMQEDQYSAEGGTPHALDGILYNKSAAKGAGIHNALGRQ